MHTIYEDASQAKKLGIILLKELLKLLLINQKTHKTWAKKKRLALLNSRNIKIAQFSWVIKQDNIKKDRDKK